MAKFTYKVQCCGHARSVARPSWKMAAGSLGCVEVVKVGLGWARVVAEHLQ